MGLFGGGVDKVKPEDAFPGFAEDVLDPSFSLFESFIRPAAFGEQPREGFDPESLLNSSQNFALDRFQRTAADTDSRLGSRSVGTVLDALGGRGLTSGQDDLADDLIAGRLRNPAARGAARFAETGGGPNAALEGFQDFARTGGRDNAALGGFQDIARTGGGQNPALAGFQDIAQGGQLNPAIAGAQRFASGEASSPYLDATFGNAARVVGEQFRENTVPGLDSAFARSGRLGSQAYANQRNRAEEGLGRTFNDLATDIYGGAYQQDQNRQLSAVGLQGQLLNQDVGNQLTAYGNIGQLGQQNVQNRLAGLGGAGGLDEADIARQFAGLQQVGGLDAQRQANQLAGLNLQGQLGQQDINNRLAGSNIQSQGLGQAFQGIQLGNTADQLRFLGAQNTLNAGNLRQDLPLRLPERAIGLAAGQQAPSSPGQPGITGGQLLGTAAGLGGAFLLSDERLKEDVRPTGLQVGGVPVKSWRYDWDEPETTRLGVTAQDAARKRPDAVARHPSGYYMVDYARLGSGA